AQDTTPPEISVFVPDVGATVRSLQWVSLTFSEAVAGVDAGDLLLDGQPATRVTGAGRGPYVFSFEAATGQIVRMSWKEGHGITDLASPPNAFGGGTWAYRIDPALPPSRLSLSEILADNPGGLEDADGDSPDWIEIRNDGSDWVNLEGWALTDSKADPGRWVFPSLLLEPGGFLVVFASGKDRRPEGGGELHTNFKLDLGGEYLALTALETADPDSPRREVSAFAPAYPEQRSGYSFGIDDTDSLRYFAVPTPGGPNGTGSVGFVEDTHFTVDRGFFEDPFEVEIATDTPGAEIRFTVDGSRPTATTGSIYDGAIAVSRTTTLRAAAFRSGLIPTNVDTQTYVFLDDVIVQTGAGFPSTWGSVPADYRVDPDVVSSALYRDTIRDDLLSIPTLSIVMSIADLFGPSGIYSNPTARGSAWERPASAELIHPDGREGFQIDAGAQIFGGASRTPTNTGKHSIRLVFKGIYGAAQLDYRLFEDSDVEAFDTIMLRGGYNYKWTHSSTDQQTRAQYARDEFARQCLKDMGQPCSHGFYVHLYLNGLYWGMYNLVERPDESFASAYLGGDKDDYDVIKAGEPPYAISGDKDFWNEMLALANGGLAGEAAYAQIQEYLDVDSLVDYTILNHYIGNVDGPVCICGTNRPRNFYAARLREPGGKYHFFPWDSEHSLAETNVDRTEIGVADADDTPARLYARMRQNAEFRVRFGDHVHRHFASGGALTPQASIDRWMANASRIDRAIVGESARWGDYRRSVPYTRDVEWLAEQSRIVSSYLPVRSSIVLNQFRNDGLYPSIAAPVFQQNGGLVPPGFSLVMAAPEGAIYYTLDDSDPRLAGGAIAPAASRYEPGATETLIPPGTACRVIVPADGTLGLDWTASDFDAASWLAGTTGVGFERGTGYEDLVGTDVEAAMYGVNASVYIRISFEVTDPGSVVSLLLRMKYDDGFVAFLNGQEVARSNAPETLEWNAGATSSNPDASALEFQEFDISGALALLGEGMNILALQGLNAGAASSDMLILPDLAATRAGSSQISLTSPVVRVKARALSGSQWSALQEARFVLDRPAELRVTEIMYHPVTTPSGSAFESKEFEFIELRNIGDEALDLAGIRIGGGIAFSFPEDAGATSLAPGAYAVLVKNQIAFAERYGAGQIHVAGEYSGSLGNGGDRILLEDAAGRPILDFVYDEAWYPATDGEGYSLHIRDSLGPPESWSRADGWQASLAIHGSPGRGESDPSGGGQIPGDTNQDGRVDLSDAVALLANLFTRPPTSLPCEGQSMEDAGNLLVFDLSGDGGVDITDPIYLLRYLFLGGSAPFLGTECVLIEGCRSVCSP
ncbi:MAG: CotH kinase family protein, partial [Planctomycetes bacterium]|nr:CotH kinase family protein [Planctomycetota bacterium]